jgi:hypothetical protein
LPGAGAFVFSFCLIFFYLSTDQAMVWRRMETGDGSEDGWTFGGLRSGRTSWIKLCFWRRVGEGFFLYAIAEELHATVIIP